MLISSIEDEKAPLPKESQTIAKRQRLASQAEINTRLGAAGIANLKVCAGPVHQSM